MNNVQDRNALVVANLKLAYWIASRLRGCRDEDSRQTACLALIRAARLYDPARGPFGAYAGRCIWRRLLWERRRAWRVVRPASLDLMTGREGGTLAAVPPVAAEELMDLGPALARLEPWQRALIAHRFWDAETLEEIGRRDGLTREAVRLRLANTLKALRKALGRPPDSGE